MIVLDLMLPKLDGLTVLRRLREKRNPARAELRVANTGSTLSQDQAGQVFTRFWRGDTARSNTGVHSGLGLSLTRKILHVLGGSTRARSSAGGEFEITLSTAGSKGRQP